MIKSITINKILITKRAPNAKIKAAVSSFVSVFTFRVNQGKKYQ
jgi:hypothetical protein